jgi:hypothetical protein
VWTETTLSWDCANPNGEDTLTYDVYFGTDSSPTCVSTDQTKNTYDPGTLATDTTYYWKIDVSDGTHEVEGDVWSFTTTSIAGNILFEEDFETGDFSAHNWVLGGDASPFLQTEEVSEGNYAVQFGDIGDYQSSYLEVEVTLASDIAISFYRKTRSQGRSDHLQLYIDDAFAGEWSGDIGWHQVIREIPSGTHTLKWVYIKDSSISDYEDTVWIDDIKIVDNMYLGEEVNVPDSNLKLAILNYLGKNQWYTANVKEKLNIKKHKSVVFEKEDDEKEKMQDFLDYDSGKIYTKELIGLVELNASGRNVSDITGLEYLENVIYLQFYNNEISNIKLLKSLKRIKYLCLEHNNIEDIQPLVDNPGIGSGDSLYLSYNYLDLTEGSEDVQDIQELLDRGVNVEYEPQN